MSRRISDHPPALLSLAAIAWCVLVAVADYASGDEIPLAILYLPVVALFCWQVSLKAAFVMAACCSFVWLLDDLLLPGNVIRTATHYWLASVHFVFFVVVATVLSRLRLAYDHERRLARTDYLTGLANRSAFMEASERALAEAKSSRRPISTIYLDCDNFKSLNDELGHQAGDALLRQAAGILRRLARPADVAARLGGDEFAVLLPDTGAAEAERLAARMQVALDAAARDCHAAVSFSYGTVSFVEPPCSVDALLHAADQQMYAAKRERKADAADELAMAGA
jgi:diguanylate cyclase (GGDEF)-like protein